MAGRRTSTRRRGAVIEVTPKVAVIAHSVAETALRVPSPRMAESETELQKSLKSRHMTMISLGGVIGAGLFVGSSAVINTTGPAAVLSYLPRAY